MNLAKIKEFIKTLDNKIQNFTQGTLDQVQDSVSDVYTDYSNQMNQSMSELQHKIDEKYPNNQYLNGIYNPPQNYSNMNQNCGPNLDMNKENINLDLNKNE